MTDVTIVFGSLIIMGGISTAIAMIIRGKNPTELIKRLILNRMVR